MAACAYNVYVSPVGNVFMTELADMIVETLRTLGRPVSVFNTGLPEPNPDTINLVIAPHEFFLLLRDRSNRDIERAAAASVCIGTEQPGTPWFETGAHYCAAGSLCLDINAHAVDELTRRGINAVRLPLGYYPGWDRWDGDVGSKRSRDLLFLGGLTERREHFMAASGRLFWDYDCEFRFFDFDRPVTGSAHFLSGQAKYDVLADTRILLNVHRGPLGYFEWVRVLEAMANGCLVLTETSEGYEPLVPFDHFVQAPLDTLAEYAVALLQDEDTRSEIANDAYQFIRTKLAFADALEARLPAIEAANRTSLRPATDAALVAPREPRRRPRQAEHETESSPSPRSAALMAGVVDTERRARARIKELLLSEISFMRSIEAIASAISTGSVDNCILHRTSAFDELVPDASVVLSVYNYAHYVGDAIDSVVNGTGLTAEIVVVDDHSTDGSRDVIEAKMREYDWFPICLIEKSANQGLSAARNTGFQMARSEFVFVLDADNLIYPQALKKLLAALESSDAAFAYGIIEKFGSTSGLLSCLPWDVLRLTNGNYIDAMALVRRSAWQDMGGYDQSMDLLGGWEDYDFWLRLASEGRRGILVPEIVARYRVHGTSMLTTLNLDPTPIVHEVRRKYPLLPWPSS